MTSCGQGRTHVDLQASAVRFLERGVVITGAPGSGKSALVAEIMARGGWLIADDLVRLERHGAGLMARAAESGALIEIRGHAIARLAACGSTTVDLILDLDRGSPERLPACERTTTLLGVEIPTAAFKDGGPCPAGRLALILHGSRVPVS